MAEPTADQVPERDSVAGEESMDTGDNAPEEDGTAVENAPQFGVQKTEIHTALQQRLKKGETWYLLDVRWIKQWKKYVGYDQWDQTLAGQDSADPGPIDNSNLFKDFANGTLKEHLMEELDYYLLPESAWSKLLSWYGISQGSRPIQRKVVEHGLYMKHCKVEVYLLEFKLSVHSNQNEVVIKQFSRASTVAELEDQLKETFSIVKDAECRVWHRYMTNTYELLSNSSQSLQDAGLYNGQTIVLEVKKEDGTWPRSTQVTPSSQHPTRSSDDNFSTPSSSISRGSSTTSGYSSAGTSWSSYSQKPSSPGLCGLSNLGNTCFMNSALQCMSNTLPLTEYFLGTPAGYKPYKKHINKSNPLGMGGAIAEAYGALLEDMWSGKFNCVAPRQFKTQVGRYAPQFVGYAQHDSQELLAFLLDGLHEDLNLVREKPYVDMTVETENRSDKEIAEETWLKYMLRNQSVIVRLFQGQLKSTVCCPECQKISKTFDPFMFLSLPLPIKKTRNVTVRLVSLDPDEPLKKYKLQLPKRGCVMDLKKELQKSCGTQTSQMIVVDVYNSRFHRVYADRDSLSIIMDRDEIFVYELAVSSQEDMIHLPVYHREDIVRDVRYSSTSYQQHYFQLFGLPMIVTVPQECSYQDIYQAVLQKAKRYIKSWTKVKNEELLSHEEMDTDGDVKTKDEDEALDKMNHDNNELSRNGRENNIKNQDHLEDDLAKSKDQEMNEAEKTDENEPRLFRLTVVNSYGSQEVQKLEVSKTYKFSSQTYIACDWQNDTKEKCYDKELALELVEDESCSITEVRKNLVLMDCLKLFTQTEILSKDDAWYCPNCKELVQATKKFDLWRLPDVLVIHLKRFSYDRYWRDKLDVMVEFPIDGLDLTGMVHCHDDPHPLYDLFAVANHFGGMGGGHYTAYAKNKANQKWYNFDDSHVSEAGKDHIVASSAYVLFYQRRTEGRPVNILDRSLSQSFAEERKILSNKYKGMPHSTVEEAAEIDDSINEEESNNEESNNEVFSRDANNTELDQPD